MLGIRICRTAKTPVPVYLLNIQILGTGIRLCGYVQINNLGTCTVFNMQLYEMSPVSVSCNYFLLLHWKKLALNRNGTII
jgi:hypothetical protein